MLGLLGGRLPAEQVRRARKSISDANRADLFGVVPGSGLLLLAVVPVLADAGVVARPVGWRSPVPPPGRWPRSCCWLAAQALGFEAIFGAFLAGLLVRAIDPDPETTHPLYPVTLAAVGYGLLVPVFFVTSGLTLDLSGLVEHPAAPAMAPAFLVALVVVRALPAVAFRPELGRRELLAVGLLQATSLPFLLAAVEIGDEMGLLDPAVGAGLVAAGLVSVPVFPRLPWPCCPDPPRSRCDRGSPWADVPCGGVGQGV